MSLGLEKKFRVLALYTVLAGSHISSAYRTRYIIDWNYYSS
jgi:hypothetical protein